MILRCRKRISKEVNSSPKKIISPSKKNCKKSKCISKISNISKSIRPIRKLPKKQVDELTFKNSSKNILPKPVNDVKNLHSSFEISFRNEDIDSVQSDRILRSNKKSSNTLPVQNGSFNSSSKKRKTLSVSKCDKKSDTSKSKKLSLQNDANKSCLSLLQSKKSDVSQNDISLKSFNKNKKSKKCKSKSISNSDKVIKNKSTAAEAKIMLSRKMSGESRLPKNTRSEKNGSRKRNLEKSYDYIQNQNLKEPLSSVDQSLHINDIHTSKVVSKNSSKVTSKANNSSRIIQNPTKTSNRNKRHTDPALRNQGNNTYAQFSDVTMKTQSLRTPNLSYCLRSIPVDDITAVSLSTPNTVEKFFRNDGTCNSLDTPNFSKISISKKTRCIRSSNDLISKKVVSTKGTLKRKRLIINSLKVRNEGYEDDIYENKELAALKNTLLMEEDDDDDSDFSEFSIPTPKLAFLVSPNLPAKTPRFKDCYSPIELVQARKRAEEYIYRRNKKRLSSPTKDTSKNSALSKSNDSILRCNLMDDTICPEKKKLEFVALVENLKKNLSKNKEIDSDSDQDDYFSDANSDT